MSIESALYCMVVIFEWQMIYQIYIIVFRNPSTI